MTTYYYIDFQTAAEIADKVYKKRVDILIYGQRIDLPYNYIDFYYEIKSKLKKDHNT